MQKVKKYGARDMESMSIPYILQCTIQYNALCHAALVEDAWNPISPSLTHGPDSLCCSSSELEVGESFQCRWEHCDPEEGLPGAKQGGALGHN